MQFPLKYKWQEEPGIQMPYMAAPHQDVSCVG